MSVITEESVMVVEDIGSSQGDSTIVVAGAGHRELSSNPLDVPFEKLARSEEDARVASPDRVRSETICVAADFVERSPVPCEDMSTDKDEDDLSMPRQSAAIDVA